MRRTPNPLQLPSRRIRVACRPIEELRHAQQRARPRRRGPVNLTDLDRKAIYRRLEAHRALEELRRRRPIYGLETFPHDEGQRQALASDAIIRVLIPGNGFGKTTVMAADADMLMQRSDPFKPQVMPSPDRPTAAIWFCQKFQQFDLMRPDIEQSFTTGWKWSEQKHRYTWPNGSTLYAMSSDSDWSAVQGVQIDAVYFDEHPDKKFWTEMMFRRRGKKRTRFMVAATMTQGITWFVREIVHEWESESRRRGLTHAEALELQPHPRIFLWDRGGIRSNPAMSEEDAEHYEQAEGLSEKERTVRLTGGYADFTGDSVFDAAGLDRMDTIPGEEGIMVWLPDEDLDLADRIKRQRDPNVEHRFGGLIQPDLVEFRPGAKPERGRITIFEHPDPEAFGHYVIGADFAAGLLGKDYDAAVVGLMTEDGHVRQVAEARGHWGDVFFAETLWLLGTYYGEAFICGERQFGLPCLRRLYDEMGYGWLYTRRASEKKGERTSDNLGHHRSAGDTVIPNYRLAIARNDMELRSVDTVMEHRQYVFRPRAKTRTMDDVGSSSELITSAPDGENDDMVLAGAYAWHAARNIARFVRPKRAYAPGTFGEVFKVDKVLRGGDAPRRDPYAIRR